MGNETTPCTSCGACCAVYRVSFLRKELDSEVGGTVPAALAEALGEQGARMRRCADGVARCVALQGRIGERVSCAIYERRPSPCRAFAPQAAFGQGDVHCGEARRRHGLPPLGGSYDAIVLA